MASEEDKVAVSVYVDFWATGQTFELESVEAAVNAVRFAYPSAKSQCWVDTTGNLRITLWPDPVAMIRYELGLPGDGPVACVRTEVT